MICENGRFHLSPNLTSQSQSWTELAKAVVDRKETRLRESSPGPKGGLFIHLIRRCLYDFKGLGELGSPLWARSKARPRAAAPLLLSLNDVNYQAPGPMAFVEPKAPFPGQIRYLASNGWLLLCLLI